MLDHSSNSPSVDVSHRVVRIQVLMQWKDPLGNCAAELGPSSWPHASGLNSGYELGSGQNYSWRSDSAGRAALGVSRLSEDVEAWLGEGGGCTWLPLLSECPHSRMSRWSVVMSFHPSQ